MKSILITGGTGLIGSRLIKEIDKSEYQIYILTRKKISDKNGIKYIQWDPDNFHIRYISCKKPLLYYQSCRGVNRWFQMDK